MNGPRVQAELDGCGVSALGRDHPIRVTTTAGANGTITPANPPVNYAANQTFAIAGNTGYHVLDVLVDRVSQGPVATY